MEASVRQVVRGRDHQPLVQLPRPAPGDARGPDRADLRGRARRPAAIHLPRDARRGVQVRERAQVARNQEGRPSGHLPADDSRGGDRHAGLRADRRGAFGGVRWILSRGAPGKNERRRSEGGGHLGRRMAEGHGGPAEGQCRSSPRRDGDGGEGRRCPAHREDAAGEGTQGRSLDRADVRSFRNLRAGMGGQ